MWRRFGLSIVTVILYIFISSVVIVLAQGYTVDLQTRKFLTTGLAEINTFPSGAVVTVDGVDIKKTTPVNLSHYLPGTYTVDMAYSGYQNVSFPIDIVSELVTHVDEVALFPRGDNWRNLQMSSSVLKIEAFPGAEMLLVKNADGIGWWILQKRTLVKVYFLPVGVNAKYSCTVLGDACIVVDGNQAYFVDVLHHLSKKLKGIPVFQNTRSLYKFHGDYVVFAKQGGDITMQKLSADGTISMQIFEEGVDAFQVSGQDVWFVKNSVLWKQSLISGLPQKITEVDTADGKVEKLFVLADYVIWQKTTGEVVLFDTSLEAIMNIWSHATVFDHGEEGLALTQNAKIWFISPKKGLLFSGQAAHDVIMLEPYSKVEWLAKLQDGHYALVLVEPAKILPIENDFADIAIIPYKGIIATTQGTSDTLFYHLFPEQSWMNTLINN